MTDLKIPPPPNPSSPSCFTPVTFLLCVHVGVVCEEYNIMFIHYFQVLWIHVVDLVKRSVLTFVDEMPYYRKDR